MEEKELEPYINIMMKCGINTMAFSWGQLEDMAKAMEEWCRVSRNMDIKDNQIMLLKEDLECVHLFLDDKKVPRQDDKGETYSIVGRIKQFENRMMKESSELETEYLHK